MDLCIVCITVADAFLSCVSRLRRFLQLHLRSLQRTGFVLEMYSGFTMNGAWY